MDSAHKKIAMPKSEIVKCTHEGIECFKLSDLGTSCRCKCHDCDYNRGFLSRVIVTMDDKGIFFSDAL